jgi:uncharacterized protein with NAD-binding domain and iron-sulfur cluster
MSAPIFVEARWLPYFVTPDDVRDKKARIDALLRGLDVAIVACPTIPDVDRQRWALFLAGWATFRDEPGSWFHTATQDEQASAYELDAKGWAEWFARQACAGTSTAPSISTWGERPDDTSPGMRETKSTIKTVAIAGAVIAVALGLRAGLGK